MVDIKADINAKYGQNLLNADQFRAQTNMTIDEALKNIGLTVFDKKAIVNKFKDSLNDVEFAPILNALKAAAE